MISQKMIQEHLKKSLSEGGIISDKLKIKYLPAKETDYLPIQELAYENPENKAFYGAAYVLMDNELKEMSSEHKRRIGGFNLYPIGFNADQIDIKPRVFSGRYRMGFCNFELAASMLSGPVLKKLNKLYQDIRKEVESEVLYNFEDSTLVLHRTSWEPPHFHVQDKTKADQIDSISVAVRISGNGSSSSVFDFFSDKFDIFDSSKNHLTKIYFKGKYIHQVFKKDLKDNDLYFFFVWDGCVFKKPLDLENDVYVERYYHSPV